MLFLIEKLGSRSHPAQVERKKWNEQEGSPRVRWGPWRAEVTSTGEPGYGRKDQLPAEDWRLAEAAPRWLGIGITGMGGLGDYCLVTPPPWPPLIYESSGASKIQS